MSLLENLIEYINVTKIEGYQPASKTGLSYSTIKSVSQSNTVVSKVIAKRAGSVNQNSWHMFVNVSNLQRKNDLIEARTYDILKNQININDLIREISIISSIYGCCYVEYTKDNQFIVHEPTYWQPYYNVRYKKLTKVINTIDKLSYEFGNEIYRFDDPLQTNSGVPVSFIDVAFDAILLHHHAIKVNDNLISQGGVGAMIALIEKEYESRMNTPTDLDDPHNQNKLAGNLFLTKLKESLGLSKRSIAYKKETPSHGLAMAIGVKEIVQLSKNNQDMQLEMLIKYCENKIYDAACVTNSDQSSTYNNSANFNYQLYDDIARPYEDRIENLINNFVLPKLGLKSNENFYFEFNKANDPDELAKNKFHLELASKTLEQSTNTELKAVVINELRDRLNLSMIDLALFESQQPTLLTAIDSNINDVQKFSFANAIEVEAFAKKTPIQKALDSVAYETLEANPKDPKKKVKKGLKPSFEKALNQQLDQYIANTANYDTLEQYVTNIDKNVGKLESYYSFNILIKDLLKFTDVGLRELNLTDKEYPDYLIEYVNDRAKGLLKGKSDINKDQESTDNALKNELLTLISNTTIENIRDDLTKFKKEYSKTKAELIARTEVGEITEQSRYLVYTNNNYKTKQWVTVNDSKVRVKHSQNEKDGIIGIDEEFSSGDKRAGVGYNCRCTIIYYE